MKQKSKSSPSKFTKFVKIILLLFASLITGAFFFIGWGMWHYYFYPFSVAEREVKAMRHWELPAESEIISFETEVIGASSSYVMGELTIRTTLSETEIADFYHANYQPDCLGFEIVRQVEIDEDIQNTYLICHVVEIDD